MNHDFQKIIYDKMFCLEVVIYQLSCEYIYFACINCNTSVQVLHHEFYGQKTIQNAIEISICCCAMTHTEFQICIGNQNLNKIRI